MLRAILPPLALIIAVLGTILGGIATPTEAASVGAIGAVLLAGWRQSRYPLIVLAGIVALVLLIILSGLFPVRFQRSDITLSLQLLGSLYILLALIGGVAIGLSLYALFRRSILTSALTSTMTVTTMIFATILTASIFSLVFIGLGGEAHIHEILKSMPGGATGALFFSMLLIFILGFFLDFVEITVILLPLIMPALIMMGHDPIWLAILIAINLQTSFLTPPFGFSLFYLRGAAPKEITTGQIYRGVAPFIVLQVLGMGLIWGLPILATWLPGWLF
ncbi:MAG: hypothetical protein CSA45_05855 [Gammaproteobacteria bacterium]|nr:MAG: hypothetical protein CSA45_05855 [Gammaproteobacteria bacterium]